MAGGNISSGGMIVPTVRRGTIWTRGCVTIDLKSDPGSYAHDPLWRGISERPSVSQPLASHNGGEGQCGGSLHKAVLADE